MPPRTTLFELATRRNIYVCRSCLTALGVSQPATIPARRFRSVHGLPGADDNHGDRVKVRARSAKAPEPLNETPPKGLVINYFEKDPKTGEITRVPDAKELGLEEDGEDDGENLEDLDFDELEASFDAKASKIDDTMRKLEKRQSGVLEKIVAKHGPPGALEALQKVLDGYGVPEQYPEDEQDLQDSAKHADGIESAEGAADVADVADTQDAEEVEGVEEVEENMEKINVPAIHIADSANLSPAWSREVDRHCTSLSRWIKRAVVRIRQGEFERNAVALNWRRFDILQPLISRGQVVVPPETWDALWEMFSREGLGKSERMARIKQLYRTMSNAGIPLSDGRHLLAIEATFEDGSQDEALESWKRLAVDLGSREKSAATLAYWELGIRMFSYLGDHARAERASKALFERASPDVPADPRVLLHLMRAYLAHPDTAEKGFLLYRRMRDLAAKLNKPMEIGDFDDVIALFLNIGHTDFAMYAFTDMMFAGAINLYGKSKLPNQLKNNFFFGKWLKRLIGAGDLDGAYKVLVYMQRNGVLAASIQVNGLIGAWLRTGLDPARRKAEKLAHAMIGSRKAFVDLRERQRFSQGPIRLVDNRPDRSSSRQRPGLDYGLVPRATVETFIILATNYRERKLFTSLEKLFVEYKKCRMPGDAMMMNELMMAAVAQNRGDKARELYHLMVHEHGILPSADTFAILFSSLEVNLLREQAIRPAMLPQYQCDVRGIFSEMLASSWVYADQARHNRLSQSHARLILHSFRKTKDWAGVATALAVLRSTLQFRMTRVVVLEMLAGIEGIDRPAPSPRVHKAALRATVQLHGMLRKTQARGQFLGPGPGEDDDAAADSVKDPDVLYRILREHYLIEVQHAYPEPGEARRRLQEAKEEMGFALAGGTDAMAEEEKLESQEAMARVDVQPGRETAAKEGIAARAKRKVGYQESIKSPRRRRQRVFDR